MKITPIAFLLIFIIVLLIIKNHKRKLNIYHDFFKLYFFVSITMNIGFVFKIGNFDLGIDTFLSFILMVLALFAVCKGCFDKRVIVIGLLFCGCIMIGIIGMLVNPYTGLRISSLNLWDAYVMGAVDMTNHTEFKMQSVFFLISAFRFTLILSTVCFFYKKGNHDSIFSVVNSAVNVVIVYGLMEIVFKKIFHIETTPILNLIFGEADATANGLDRLQGLCKEPSHYAFILFGLVMFQIIRLRKSRKEKLVCDKIKLLILLALMLVSGSFNALIFFMLAVFIYFYFVVPTQKKPEWLLFGALIFIILLFIVPNVESISRRIDRLVTVIKSLSGGRFQTGETSEAARFISIVEMIKISFNRPLFGIGIGSTDAHSTLAAILGNCGYIGLILYLMTLYKCGNAKFKGYKLFYVLMLIPMLISGGIGYLSQTTIPILLLSFGSKTNFNKEIAYENDHN